MLAPPDWNEWPTDPSSGTSQFDDKNSGAELDRSKPRSMCRTNKLVPPFVSPANKSASPPFSLLAALLAPREDNPKAPNETNGEKTNHTMGREPNINLDTPGIA
mmetsp:Transcript_2000/g.4055  ORF Transcript_2000/g.4055 Transcript_2000/m.4055 type:complete len:104 (-) Transcript_2000:120-431(-)